VEPAVPSARRRPAAVASALAAIRERLPLAAPAPRLRHLAFGSGFLLQLREAEARLVNSNDGSVIANVALAGPRAALGLPGGSVLACASDASYRFDPGQRTAHRGTRVSLLPNSLLEPSRESQEFLWVIEPSLGNAVRYAFATKEFGVEATRTLPGYDGKALTTLLDGAFLYTSSQGLVRTLASRTTSLALPSGVGRIWRLLPADRVDRAWAVTDSGEAILLELGARARVVRRFQTSSDGAPFDVAAVPGTLAMVSVHEAVREPRSFVLNTYSATGTRIKSYILAGVRADDASEDWAKRVSIDREVAITTHPPRVAVGGPTELRLFDLASGDEIVAP